MTKKKITKIDPREELSPYLNHESAQKNHKKRNNKVSASLHNLRAERKHSLFKSLGLILGVSTLAILALGYYISPLTNVNSVEVKGASDLPAKEVVRYSGIKVTDRVFDYQLKPRKPQKKLTAKYPEVKGARVSVQHWNQLTLQIEEYRAVGYLKDGERYRKILASGEIGSQSLPWEKVQTSKPLFVGYNHKTSFKQDMAVFNSLPVNFKKKVKLLSGNAARKKQIVLVMKDGNVVIGNVSTLKEKVKYYDAIKAKAGKNSLIDLELGAYSRSLTLAEKKAYGIS